MTQMEIGITVEEKQYGIDDVPGALVKGLNRKRAKERKPRQIRRSRKKEASKTTRAITLSLW